MMLKLATVNIEGDKHLDRVLPFLESKAADVVCLQEIFAVDVDRFTEKLDGSLYFVPHTNLTDSQQTTLNPKGLWGIALWVRNGLTHDEPTHCYYRGDEVEASKCKHPGYDASRAVLVVTVKESAQQLTIATTHFTWTPDGVADERQRTDVEKLMAYLERYPELVLCGDFNAPRGEEIFNRFRERFTDHLPKEVTSTLDPELHYIKDQVQVVVDTIFATPGVKITEVAAHEGISDHKALTATISTR